MTPNYLSLFAGIGGIDLGLDRAGFRADAQVELDPFCADVLARRWPEAPRHDDVRTFDAAAHAGVFLVAGGFPCQAVSVAGRQRGESDERWLWPAMAKVIADARPRWVLGENVPGLLSVDDGAIFGRILLDLDRLGYRAWWHVAGAVHAGALHLRDRVWILARRLDDDRDLELEAPPPPAAFMATAADWASGRWEADLPRTGGRGPAHVERLRALGNAVVPSLPEYWARVILGYEGHAPPPWPAPGGEFSAEPLPTPIGTGGGNISRGGDRSDELLLGGFAARHPRWPTPTSMDGTRRGKELEPEHWEEARKRHAARGVNKHFHLSVAVNYWPTPTSTDADKGSPRQRDSAGRPALTGAANQRPPSPTPTASDALGSRRATARKDHWTSKEGTTLTDFAWTSDDTIGGGTISLPPPSAAILPEPTEGQELARLVGDEWTASAGGSTQILLFGEGLERFRETWPRSGAMLRGVAYGLEPLTSRPNSRSYDTPVSRNHRAPFPTPLSEQGTSSGNGTGGNTESRGRPTLTSMATRDLWPTPTTPAPHDSPNTAGALHINRRQYDLPQAVRDRGDPLFPTPNAVDADRKGADYARADREGSGGDDLQTRVLRDQGGQFRLRCGCGETFDGQLDTPCPGCGLIREAEATPEPPEEPPPLWRTPSASDSGVPVERLETSDGGPPEVGRRAYRRNADGELETRYPQSVSLSQQVNFPEGTDEPLFPTPCAGDRTEVRDELRPSRTATGRATGYLSERLGQDIKAGLIPTPDANAHKGANKPGQRRGQINDPAMGVISAGKALNPAWVEALMGFPPGWTDPKRTEGPDP